MLLAMLVSRAQVISETTTERGEFNATLSAFESPPVRSALFSHSRFQVQLVETGTKKLAHLFTKLVAPGSSGSHPVGSDFHS